MGVSSVEPGVCREVGVLVAPEEHGKLNALLLAGEGDGEGGPEAGGHSRLDQLRGLLLAQVALKVPAGPGLVGEYRREARVAL